MEEMIRTALRSAVEGRRANPDLAVLRMRVANRKRARHFVSAVAAMLVVLAVPLSIYAAAMQGSVFTPSEADKITGQPGPEVVHSHGKALSPQLEDAFRNSHGEGHHHELEDVDPSTLSVQFLNFSYVPKGFSLYRTVRDGGAIVKVLNGPVGKSLAIRYTLTKVQPKLVVDYAWKSTIEAPGEGVAELFGFKNDPDDIRARWQVQVGDQWATYELVGHGITVDELKRVLAGLH